MSKLGLHRVVRSEIDFLVAQGILSPAQAARVRERYPTAPWDLSSLARWFTVLGAVTSGAGLLLLGAQMDAWRTLLEVMLVGAVVGLLGLGRWLARSRRMTRSGAALELLAGFALQGLTIALATHYSVGTKNWPGLVGVDAALLLALAYVLGNRLLLVHALVNLFFFVGGETGYVSGWGMYWLGLTYPLRFLGISLAVLGVAWLHGRLGRDAWRAFSRVYLHSGLLGVHLSLWFLSVFGLLGADHPGWSAGEGERVAFSALWAAASMASVWLAGRTGVATLRAYAVTFFVIDCYTFYFQFVAARSAVLWWLHLLLVGGSLVLLALRVERRRAMMSASAPRASG